MRNNNSDKTLKNNYIQTYQFLIEEYEQVKAKQRSAQDGFGGFTSASSSSIAPTQREESKAQSATQAVTDLRP